jgi:uncharacterized protein (TIGR02266 family)
MNEARPALQRRRTERLETEVEIDVESDHNFYTGFSSNLSDGGIFVATYRTHAVGDRLRVRVRLPGTDAVEAKVEVRWVRSPEPGADVVPGFGAAFVELADDARRAIEDFVARRSPLFYAE